MSLINQALKKEQQRRSGPPDLRGVPMPPAHQALVAKRDKGDKNTKIVIGACVTGVTFLVVLTMVSVAGVKRIFNNPGTSTTDTVHVERIPTHFVAGDQTSSEVGENSDSATEMSLAQTSSPPPATEIPSESVSRETQSTPAVIKTPAAPLPQPNPETQLFLENLNFQAVRLAEEHSRLLLDGRVYKIGNLLGEEGNRLVFKGVEGSLLIFEDSSGATYKISG